MKDTGFLTDILERGSSDICKNIEKDESIELVSVSFEYRDYIDTYKIYFHVFDREYRLIHDRESKVIEDEKTDIIARSGERDEVCKQLDTIVQSANLSGLFIEAW